MNEVNFMGTLKMPHNGQLIEGHPIGIDKIIKGDLREQTWISNGEIFVNKHTEGEVLYDRTDVPHRPWFVLVYESGRRCVD
jgi:hypothetical protein